VYASALLPRCGWRSGNGDRQTVPLDALQLREPHVAQLVAILSERGERVTDEEKVIISLRLALGNEERVAAGRKKNFAATIACMPRPSCESIGN
jgi:hypothetical protein